MERIDLPGGVYRLDFQGGDDPLFCDDASFGAAPELASSLVRGGEAGALLLCGPTCSGKSHLLRALLREEELLREGKAGNYRIAEEWILEQAQHPSGEKERRARDASSEQPVLVLEDLQFLRGKRATLRFLAGSVRESLKQGRSVLLVSDVLFPELTAITEEWKRGGLPASSLTIGHPGRACRRAYAEACGRRLGLRPEPALLDRLSLEHKTICALRSALLSTSLETAVSGFSDAELPAAEEAIP